MTLRRLEREREHERASREAPAPAPLPPALLAAGNHAVAQLLSRRAWGAEGPKPGEKTMPDPEADASDPIAATPEAIEAAVGRAQASSDLSGVAGSFEEKGKGRRGLVERIRQLREAIDQLPDDDQRTAFHLRVNELAPYYTQVENAPILNDMAWHGTCNCTTVAMGLEQMGLSVTDFQGDEKKMKAIATHFRRTPETMRLADFIQLVTIHVKLGGRAANARNIEAAKAAAWGWIDKGSAPVITLFGQFGVTARMVQPEKPVSWALHEIGKGHTAKKDISEAIDARQRKERGGQDEAEAHEAVLAGGRAVKGRQRENRQVELEGYKSWVRGEVEPFLNRGKPVIVGQWNHWTRLQEINDDYVVVDDPGHRGRSNRKTAWEEARGLGMFWMFVVVD